MYCVKKLQTIDVSFLGALEKLRISIISLVLFVSLFVSPEQFGLHWTNFHQIWYLSIFRKLDSENSSFIKTWQE